jgi:MinD-like ATPase involved in chromosome partitioning or flagellar assembly
VSEHDWQAIVLSELGVPPSGLVMPDSGARPSAPAPPKPRPEPAATPLPAEPREPAVGGDRQATDPAQPMPSTVPPAASSERAAEPQPDLSPVPPSTPPAAQSRSMLDPSLAPPSTPPAALSRSTPEPPGPPERLEPPEQRPELPERPEFSERHEEPPPHAPQSAGEPGSLPAPQQPDWEQASDVSWDQVAQAPWGPEPPARAETWEQSEAGAWQRDPGAPADLAGPQAPHRPPRPSTPAQPARPPQADGGPVGPQDLMRRSAHGDPLVRRMSRNVRRVVGSAAVNEVRRTADVENILGRAVPSCRQIAVTSIRGGAGKTTVAGLTATVIAQYRQDRVLAVDADSGLGSLPLRLGVMTNRSLHDLTAAPRSFEEAAGYLGRTPDGLWILSGTAGGQITRELDLGTFRAAAGGMNRYFSVTVIDCGAGLLPELQRGILADAHAQVMVTPGTVDGALSAHGALEWQARNGYGHLLTRTVIAFVTHTPHVDADLTRAAQMLSAGGLPVVHMPYDRHLAAGTAIESARIGQETRAAAIRVAVEAFARATSV